MYVIQAVLALVLVISGCGVGPREFAFSGKTSQKDQEFGPQAVNEFDPQLLVGNWGTGCVTSPFGEPKIYLMSFSSTGSYTDESTSFRSVDCAKDTEVESIQVKGVYSVISGRGIELRRTEMHATYHLEEAAQSASIEGRCLIRNWKVGERRNVSATACINGRKKLVPLFLNDQRMLMRVHFLDSDGVWKHNEYRLFRR